MAMNHEDIINIVRETIRESLAVEHENMAAMFDDEDDDTPLTKSFKARSLEDLSDAINTWVADTEAYVVEISWNLFVGSVGSEYEALVLYIEDKDDTPDWLKGMHD